MTTDAKRGRNYEKHVAEQLHGEVIPASGAGEVHKGDVKTRGFLIDCKHTNKAQYILKLEDLRKIEKYAARDGRTGAMVIGIGGKDYALVPMSVLESFENE